MNEETNNCVFCKIIAGEIPSYKVYEDDDFLAFLDGLFNYFSNKTKIAQIRGDLEKL